MNTLGIEPWVDIDVNNSRRTAVCDVTYSISSVQYSTLQYMSVTPPPPLDREPTVDSGSFGREVEVCGGHCRKRTLLFCARPIFQSAIVFRLCYFRNLAQREARRSKERLLLKPDDDSTREKVTAAPLTKTQPGFFFWPFILDINSIFWFAGELFDSWTF